MSQTNSSSSKIVFGEFGLKTLTGGSLSPQLIEAVRKVLSRHLKSSGGKIYIRLSHSYNVTKKPLGVRMGSGKGGVDGKEFYANPGSILFEISGVTEALARSAITAASLKIHLPTSFIARKFFYNSCQN